MKIPFALFLVTLFFCTPAISQSDSYVPEYILPDTGSSIRLNMDYASAEIRNPSSWKDSSGRKKIYRIDLIYTKYPVRRQDWITPYDQLLSDRIKAIKKLISPADSHEIQWNNILQTNCLTEKKAKEMFHGAVVWYQLTDPVQEQSSDISIIPLPEKDTALKKPGFKPYKVEYPIDISVGDLASGRYPFADSVVFKVFDRHPEWHRMLVVNDWTGSMYDYGAQVVLWNKLSTDRKRISGIYLFNDGNGKPDHKKKIGKTGGIYCCTKKNDTAFTIKTMEKVMKKGDGGDMPENDIEALLTAVKQSEGEFEDLILVADSKSHVRDIELLYQIKTPVHVILCGAYKNSVILPEYLEIARRTGGSIHTIEEDIEGIPLITEGQTIKILDITYVYRNGNFSTTSGRPGLKKKD